MQDAPSSTWRAQPVPASAVNSPTAAKPPRTNAPALPLAPAPLPPTWLAWRPPRKRQTPPALLLPIGAPVALPVASFPPVVIAGFLSFGLMALLYLVTEELLFEAHEKPDSPLISAMFFVGFLVLLLIEEIMV